MENDKLTYGELDIGDSFIGFPLPGDNSGHGGYKQAHIIWYKTSYDSELHENKKAKRFSDGILSDFPDTMHVIKIK